MDGGRKGWRKGRVEGWKDRGRDGWREGWRSGRIEGMVMD